MKAILMSIRPEWVAKILNGEKTIEIRKKFPKDYVGWVYIYCTKDHNSLLHKNCADIWWVEDKDFQKKNKCLGIEQQPIYNGKVVARFWCDKVEDFAEECSRGRLERISRNACLTTLEMLDYIDNKVGYAIHVTNPKPFDKPKEISEFMKVSCKGCPFENTQTCHNNTDGRYCKLNRAPQSFMFIEV